MTVPRHALVIEGGGMKAAYANGVLSAFEECGYQPFDAVYGTSAGGALAAWFTARQSRYAEGTWRYAADRRIMSFRRFVRNGILLDHDALLQIVYENEMPLDQAAIRASRWPVWVTAAEVGSGMVHYQDLRRGDIIAWLKATGRLPFACGEPVAIGDLRYLDGGILDPIPVRKAIDDGHTRVTVIRNKPEGPRQPDNRLLAELAARRYPALRRGIVEHHLVKQEAADLARNPPPGVTIEVVRPDRPTGLSRLSRDLRLIQGGIETGRADGHRFLRKESVLFGTHVPSAVPTSSASL